MTYSELIQYLFNVNLFGGIKLGLNNCIRLQNILNYPDRHYSIVHVAGTNGKGSVVTKIAHTLQLSGYRVGLYTSPHISCFRERIRVNGEMIPEKAVEEILPILFKTVEQEKIPATFFELTTFLAFLHFVKEKVDVAVLETGMGGRLDATNIITPLLSVITSISLDHTEQLGPTTDEIAKEKAGIIKPNIPVVIGPKVPFTVIKEIAQLQNSACFQVTELAPTFEEENRLIAKAALQQMANKLTLTEAAIEKGLEGKQPCRFEVFLEPCPIILDVAHNPDGLVHLFKAIRRRFGEIPLRIFFGLSKSKDISSCLRIISEYGEDFHLVEAVNGRGAPIKELQNGLKKLGIEEAHIFIESSIAENMRAAIEYMHHKNQILVVCGSFFIMSAVRQTLGICEPSDAFDLNERYDKKFG